MVIAATRNEIDALGLDEDYPLTEQQISQLHESGWVLLPGLLTTEACRVLSEILEVQETEALAQGDTTSGFMDAKQNAVIKRESLGWKVEAFQALGTSRLVGGAATRMLRLPEFLFAQDATFFKPPSGDPTQFHQDYPFFPFDRIGSINIWIALVDMTPEMGPLAYLEKSHLAGPLGRFASTDIRDFYPFLNDMPVGGGKALRAGDAQVHLDLTVHGAGPNSSDLTRKAYTARYMRPDTIYTGSAHKHYDQFNLKVGKSFGESNAFSRIGAEGLIATG